MNLWAVLDFVPRGTNWPEWLKYVYKMSVIIICCDLIAIPLQVMHYWKMRRNSVTDPLTLVLCAFFVLLMSNNFFNDFIVFYTPIYYYMTFSLLLTAIITTIIALRLPATIRRLLYLPSREMLHDALNIANEKSLKLVDANDTLEDLNRKLHYTVSNLHNIIETEMWAHDKQQTIKELQALLAEIQSL